MPNDSNSINFGFDNDDANARRSGGRGASGGDADAEREARRRGNGEFGFKNQSESEVNVISDAENNAARQARREKRARRLRALNYDIGKYGPKIAPVVIIAALAITGTAVANAPSSPAADVSCTVVDKDRTMKKDGGSDMRIYMTCAGDEGTYEEVMSVGDNLFQGRFDSADRYQKLEIGKTYKVETVGPRIDLLSQFPNIIKSTPVS